jgi:hypothetical protein
LTAVYRHALDSVIEDGNLQTYHEHAEDGGDQACNVKGPFAANNIADETKADGTETVCHEKRLHVSHLPISNTHTGKIELRQLTQGRRWNR